MRRKVVVGAAAAAVVGGGGVGVGVVVGGAFCLVFASSFSIYLRFFGLSFGGGVLAFAPSSICETNSFPFVAVCNFQRVG